MGIINNFSSRVIYIYKVRWYGKRFLGEVMQVPRKEGMEEKAELNWKLQAWKIR